MATIQRRRAKDGTPSYRVRIQRKGQPVISATFPTRKECLRYASVIEGQIAEERHFTPKPTPMTLAEVLVKYTAECLPRKAPQTQHDEVWYLNYWNKTLRHKLLSEITPSALSQLNCRVN